jgi:radical SAM protein with 4Fe4S-binding SPASM domain
MINVSSLLGVRRSQSDALRYGRRRDGEHTPASSTARRPVVVWNVTRACNLACRHCYANAKRTPGPDELTNAEARAFLEDLAAYGVPAVLISGGEPLARPDLLELIAHGVALGLRFTLSTNGTLITPEVAGDLAEAGLVYAGVSIDGPEAQHDRQRCEEGAYRASVRGLRNLGRAGVRRGVRFTVTPGNVDGVGEVLSLVEDEGIERFCLYHLVPSGRGGHLQDISAAERREVLATVFAFAEEHPDVEVLTVDNPSDGPALARWLQQRDPARAERCREMLAWNAGARGGPGIGIGCVDENGLVHPDQFSRHRTLGDIRAEPFSVIWSEGRDPWLQEMRSAERPMAGPCATCTELPLCGGGMRARAELATGDAWALDPSCSLVGAGA